MEIIKKMDNYGYVAYPQRVYHMANELKKVVDDYQKNKLNNKEAKEIVLFYANTSADLLFENNKLRKTIVAKCGKTRVDVINKLLIGYQHKI